MNKFLSVIKAILMFFGVLFLLEAAAVVYLLVADPLGIRDLITPAAVNGVSAGQKTAPTGDKNPLLDQGQEAALEAAGIDPASLPTELTPAQGDCILEALGAERAAELKAGATATFADFLKSKHCL